MDVVIEKLTYSYNKGAKFAVLALSDVSLNIPEGEFYGVIGHTGSGKSTFIQHLNALIPVQNGKILIGGYDLSEKGRKAKKSLKDVRKTVGMVFQYPEYQLFAETVFEDVAFGIKNFDKSADKSIIEQKVKNALETVGLNYESIKDKSPFELSGGQKRRVAIAGVIAVEPEILVLDEPCAGLDPQGKTSLWALLHRVHKQFAKTVIVVSHDMNDVAEQCTKAVMFEKGRVLSVGTPKELFSDTALIENAGLEVPVTCYLANGLKPLFDIDTDYKVDDFCEKLIGLLQNK